MATINLLASEVMDDAAALLNDVAKNTYTYTVQIPYLNIALKELRKHFELSNLPATDQTTSSPITLVAGETEITFEPDPVVPGVDYLPNDLVDIRRAWQRPTGTSQQYIPLPRLGGLPVSLENAEINILYGYVWEDQMMKFLACTTDIDIKLEYVRQLFPLITDSTDEILCINGDSFLANRTGALVAKHVEGNDERATTLDAAAGLFLDEVLGIGAKGNQAKVTRRRPFRGSYKSRGR